MKDRILQLSKVIMALVIIFVIVPTAFAYDFKSGGLCYNVNDDGKSVTVTYENENAPRYTSLNGALNLPTSVKSGGKTYSVTAIGKNAFAGCTGITSLNIPNSITAVGDYAFRDCEGIATVTVGNSARSWGDYVFLYCSGLTTINWNVPDGVSFTVGGGTGLLTYGNPFYHTGNVKTVVFGSNVKRIPSCFCRNFTNLTSVTIPSSVTYIGTWAFAYCKSLPKVTIPAAVDSIGYEAFRGCESLATLTIPTSLTYIGNDAFYGTAWFNNQPDGVVYAANMAYRYKGTMPANTSITLKDNCIGLACEAFANQTNLKAITLNKNIKYFNWNGSTFDGCTGLTTVNWNVESCDDFSSSGYSPFKGLTGITTFNFGNTVKYIPAYLCYGLSGITGVTLSKSLTAVGNSAFENCSGMTRVDITDLAAYCNIDFRSTTSSPILYGNNLYLNGKLVTNLVIPSTVTKINSYAFRKCTSITELTIPKSVTTVGNYAFELCSNLSKVTWNVTAGNDYSQSYYSPFRNLSGIKTFVFGNNVTKIPAFLCAGCSGLTQVSIPASVTEIGIGAFSNCSGLARVDISDLNAWLNMDFGGNNANPTSYAKNIYVNGNLLTSVEFPNTITAIKNYVFSGCECLTSVTIPNSVTSIGNYSFSACSGLTSIVIPNSVTSIGRNAFSYCTGLESVLIPGSITTLGDGAFRNCTSLNTVVSRIARPQDVDYTTTQSNRWHFHLIPRTSTLYVPKGSLADYQAQSWDGKGMNPWRYSVGYYFGTMKEFVDGDVNEDEKINVGDVSTVYGVITGTDTDAARSILSDLNEDGAVNAGDVSNLYLIILGKE